MRDDIEIILISCVLELNEEENSDIIVQSFKSFSRLLMQSNEVFHEIPRRAYISMEDFSEVEKKTGSSVGLLKDVATNKGESHEDRIKFYKEPGVLLYDGLHASAFGRMNYVYRSKGIRVYLFKDAQIKVVTPYSTIDHDGFYLEQESVYELFLNEIESKDFVEEVLAFTNGSDGKIIYSHQLIKLITEIKKPFHRDYFLEYLLTPPDVDILSDFSLEIKRLLWEVCLSTEFEEYWGVDFRNQIMNILSVIGISPSSGQLIDFIKRSTGHDTNLILERLDLLEKNLKGDRKSVVDFNPNIAGIGLNGEEIYKRLKKRFGFDF